MSAGRESEPPTLNRNREPLPNVLKEVIAIAGVILIVTGSTDVLLGSKVGGGILIGLGFLLLGLLGREIVRDRIEGRRDNYTKP